MELKFEELLSLIEELDENDKKEFELEEIEMNFIKNLVKRRKKLGLSQRDLAYKTGLTQQAICSLEKCDRKPTLPNLIKYLFGIGININKLFD
ncbi:TPA: helix-turn-helix domain-containing protein [Clostridium perfringens]|jgi:DNA-binding XRE family transcriptional regulator|nr:helix-turn-helix domain-containing protein [Clostridium perfringens]MDK0578339.1 helix-turn-helix domain-containing protein [Clostridium perfringens]MDK0581249.1 helix-turn-helix domain-containing protein [Clostridium perfringens]MDM0701900.1 helix-turn-helix domain-containing protein [Clostridium perfringens]MDM0781306.1 helix-turn-helix domain-containing protein [Clostridium perfringens]